MDNYLSHRWPKGPGAQPPPMPSPQAPRPPKRSRGRVPRWVVPTVCVLLCVALLGGVCFWAVNGIVQLLADAELDRPFEDPRPWISRRVSDDSDWTPDDLPWGDPDPSVQLSVEAAAGVVLPGRDIHEKVLPSLVSVEATSSRSERQRWTSYSSGTGTIVSSGGYVLTNYHIIEDAVQVRVQLLDGPDGYHAAKVIGFDEDFDLAVLKFDPSGLDLSPARLGSSDDLAVGDRIYAVGNPMGYLTGSMTEGIVSALGRNEDASGSALGLIQLDASINPGNSGGPLLNEAGQVVGVVCAKITGLIREDGDAVEDSMVLEGMGLAIPISDALSFVNHILATGESWRPSIGIRCTEATVDGRRGIRVASVNDGVPAQEAGLREEDLIVAANGVPVTTLLELRRVLYRTGVDGELACTVVRDGEVLTISFSLIDDPEQSG